MIVLTRDELVGLGACDPSLTWFDTHAPSGRVEFPDRTALMVWAGLRDGGLYARRLMTMADKSHHGVDLSGANLTGAYLNGADLSGAHLNGADLTGAYLTGARLVGACLVGARLAGAHLVGADLWRATLTCANITRARLDGADLTRADLSGAIRAHTDPPIPGWETYIEDNIARLRRTT